MHLANLSFTPTKNSIINQILQGQRFDSNASKQAEIYNNQHSNALSFNIPSN